MVVYRADLLKLLVLLLHNITNQLKNKLCYLLIKKWFGKGNFDDMIFESAINFWFDDVDFGEDKLWKYFNELK